MVIKTFLNFLDENSEPTNFGTKLVFIAKGIKVSGRQLINPDDALITDYKLCQDHLKI